MTGLHIISLIAGFFLDLCLGDPLWLPHPIRAMGKLIACTEKKLRSLFPKSMRGELAAGAFLVLTVIVVTLAAYLLVLDAAFLVHPFVGIGVESLLCWQLLAAKSLKEESMKVYTALCAGEIEKARTAVSMIVGRDTKQLNDLEITRAAVETVAENTSDGVIAPLFFMAVGGAVGGCLYKAINTMDSMIGYKNKTYLYFGRVAARLDDLVNFIPSRLAALLMIAASAFLKMDGKQAFRIYCRDRHCHKSPNSAQTESAAAGALGVRLSGDAWYFGILYQKPFIGDVEREIEYEDIKRVNRLMYGTSFLAVLLIGFIWLWILL